MQLYKNEAITLISSIDKLYTLISSTDMNQKDELNKILSITSQILMKFQPLLKENVSFNFLYNACYDFLTEHSQEGNVTAKTLVKKEMLLSYMESFVNEKLSQYQIEVYLHQDSQLQNYIKENHHVTVLKNADSYTPKARNENIVSILIDHPDLQSIKQHADVILNESEIIFGYQKIANLHTENLDYYLYDQLYLDSKIKSLKKRQDVQVLLTGSSYTMCGLLEEEISLPARNLGVDSQDLYYTRKSINYALENNKNIKYCIMSFAYYLVGVDISLSNSIYQFKRMSEVNYPVFKDKHNFTGSLPEKSFTHYLGLSLINTYIFNYEEKMGKKVRAIQERLKDLNYYAQPRIRSIAQENSREINEENALQRVSSHNKMLRYEESIHENIELFEEMLKELKDNGVEVILYVPPVTKYYRNHVDSALKESFESNIKPLIAKYNIKFKDLFSSDSFTEEDFFDYDHLNHLGAKKLSRIIDEMITG